MGLKKCATAVCMFSLIGMMMADVGVSGAQAPAQVKTEQAREIERITAEELKAKLD
jgi:hypothetical protein